MINEPDKNYIKTNRLILRQWKQKDFDAFADMNADPRVRKYFPRLLSREESYAQARKISADIEKNNWGLWAVSVIGDTDFIGFIGLSYLEELSAFEIVWRLIYNQWNKGYATEGAKAVLQYGFEVLNLNEIIAVTAGINDRSRKVMEKIGMYRDPKDDFDMPKLPEPHPLRKHVIYRIKKSEWVRSHKK